jgi:hypothetical protein
MKISKSVRKTIWTLLTLGVCVLLWIVLVKPLSGETSVSEITVIPAISAQSDFLAIINDLNNRDRVRLDDSKQAIPNEPEKYSIFRYNIRVTNPSFKDAADIQFRLIPEKEGQGRFLVLNRYPVRLKAYAHESKLFSFNVLVETHGLTQQQIEDLKRKARLEVTWMEGFWIRSSDVKFVE